MSRERIIEEILSERKRQDIVFGEQNKDPVKWVSILTQQVGSAAKQANSFDATGNELQLRRYELEVVQVAAVALAMLECLKRGKWNETKA